MERAYPDTIQAVAYVPLQAQALQAVLDRWQGQWPQLAVWVLLPEAERAQVGLLQSLCRDRGVGLLGAIFPALIRNASFLYEGAWLMALPTMPPHLLLEDLGDNGAERLAVEIERCLGDSGADAKNKLLFCAFDAMLPNIGTLMVAAHQCLAIPPAYTGVNAGSETFSAMPCLFDAHRLVGQGVLAMVLDTSMRASVRHAYPVAESLMRATSAAGNRIRSINGQPAFDVYRDVVARECDVVLTRENFYEYAVHFPFGVVTVLDVLVRIPVALDPDGSLVCVGEIPPNASLRLLRAPLLEASHCVDQIHADLRPVGSTFQPQGLLAFYCAGRRMHFGARAVEELELLRQKTGFVGLAGALSLGEIDCANDFGFPRFHNAAIVGLPLGCAAT